MGNTPTTPRSGDNHQQDGHDQGLVDPSMAYEDEDYDRSEQTLAAAEEILNYGWESSSPARTASQSPTKGGRRSSIRSMQLKKTAMIDPSLSLIPPQWQQQHKHNHDLHSGSDAALSPHQLVEEQRAVHRDRIAAVRRASMSSSSPLTKTNSSRHRHIHSNNVIQSSSTHTHSSSKRMKAPRRKSLPEEFVLESKHMEPQMVILMLEAYAQDEHGNEYLHNMLSEHNQHNQRTTIVKRGTDVTQGEQHAML